MEFENSLPLYVSRGVGERAGLLGKIGFEDN